MKSLFWNELYVLSNTLLHALDSTVVISYTTGKSVLYEFWFEISN